MGVNYVHDALYVAASFPSAALSDKFFVPSFNFNDSFYRYYRLEMITAVLE